MRKIMYLNLSILRLVTVCKLSVYLLDFGITLESHYALIAFHYFSLLEKLQLHLRGHDSIRTI